MRKMIAFFITLTTVGIAHGSTFENMKGTYALSQCESTGKSTLDNLCSYSKVVVRPESSATAIYFAKNFDTSPLVRSFGYPANLRNNPHAKYTEQGDKLASYEESAGDLVQKIVISKDGANSFSLSMLRTSHIFNENESYSVRLRKISDEAAPLPTVGGDIDPD